MFLLKSDKYKYIICTFPKSGCTVLRLLHIYINKDDNTVIDYKFDDTHHHLEPMFYNINDKQYDDYYKIVIYRDPYERLCSAFYQKICGIVTTNITSKNKLIQQPYRLSKELNTFNSWLDSIFSKKINDIHFKPQQKQSLKFDEELNICSIESIFKNDKSMNMLVNSLMEKYSLNHRNSMVYYDLDEYRDLSDYDFFNDGDGLIKENSIPHCRYLLTEEIKTKIRNNYADDFF